MTHVMNGLGWVAVVAAGLGAIGWLAKMIVRLVRAWEAINSLVNRELGHNGGSSIKDDVYGTAISVHQLHDELHDLARTLSSLAEANHLIWPAIEAVAKSYPPEEPNQ